MIRSSKKWLQNDLNLTNYENNLFLFLSTHADRQAMDIFFTVCFCVCVCVYVCNFVRLWISLARIKLAASNLARRFFGVLGRESPILGNFALTEAQNRTIWTPTGKYCLGCLFFILS